MKFKKNKKEAEQGSDIDPDDYSLPDDCSYNTENSFLENMFEFDKDLEDAKKRKTFIGVKLEKIQFQMHSMETASASASRTVVTQWKKK